MKNSIIILIISILTITGCGAQENQINSIIASQIKTEADLLDLFSRSHGLRGND